MADADLSFSFLHFHVAYTAGGTEHETGQIGIGVGVFDDFIPDELLHDGEVGEFRLQGQ